MNDKKVIKNKILNDDDENYDDQYEEEDKINENQRINTEREYYNETLDILQTNILDYVVSENLTICEYLSIKNIDNFLNKIKF